MIFVLLDAPNTIDLGDRYVVEPTLVDWAYENHRKQGRLVPEDFYYSSDSNSEWLDAKSLSSMINAVG